MERAECEARVGQTLRRKWKLERLIGLGGMAAVYEATHKIGRKAAIKILHPEIAIDKQVRERFEQEALAVNSVGHPGVIEIQDVDETEEGSPFLVMELLEGETLADRVERSPDMPLDALLRIVDHVLDALTACHKKGVIHRDIKPENLFLLTNGKVKLLDFGIARVRAGVRTAAGTMLGTVAFMPPEQLKGEAIDSRADLFAVGATMFTVLSGRRIHLAKNDSQLALFMLTKPAPALLSVASNLHKHVGMVVDRSLAYLPQRRYPDAQTMRGDVWALQKDQRPPYAYACVSAGLDPDVVELPPAEAPTPSKPPKPTAVEGKGGRMMPVTDPQMPAFEPGGGPVPSTDPQLPAFVDPKDYSDDEGSEAPAPSDRAAASEPPTGESSEPPKPSEPPTSTPMSEAELAAASTAPDDVAISEKPNERPDATTDKGWPAVKKEDVEAAKKGETSDTEDEADDAPLSDPPPSDPPIAPPEEKDAKAVAKEQESSSSSWILVLLVLVGAGLAAWYTGVIPGFGPSPQKPGPQKPAPTSAPAPKP